MRKIKYKDLTTELEDKIAPKSAGSRCSIGMERSIGEYYFMDVDKLAPFAGQARRVFAEDGIKALQESIRLHGLRQPLTIKKSLEGRKYEIVSGERRFRAAKAVGLKRIPCIILKENENADEISLIENLHREDLHPIEFGESCFALLAKKYVDTQAELARKLSISSGKLSECIKLVGLPSEMKQYILEHQIKSREKLRAIIKNIDNVEELKKCIGMTPSRKVNFSVLRVINTNEGFIFQNNGIKRLNSTKKYELKQRLFSLIKELE